MHIFDELADLQRSAVVAERDAVAREACLYDC